MSQVDYIEGTPRISVCGWLGFKNFGDELGPYLIEKLTGTKVSPKYTPGSVKLASIGSIVCHQGINYGSSFWGSGVLDEAEIKNLANVPAHAYQKASFYALRGPLTAMALINTGKCSSIPKVFSDPAILIPYVYQAKPSPQRYELGIICHHSQNIEALQRLVAEKYGEKVRVISIFREGDEQIEQCIDEICSCDKIASTSLHGIVVAQAYGIPALFLQDLTKPFNKNSCFKFNDYFLGTKQKAQPPLKFNDYAVLIPQLLAGKFLAPPNFRDLGQNLLDVFPVPDLLKIKQLPY